VHIRLRADVDHAEYDEEKEAGEMAAKVGAEFFHIPIQQNDLGRSFCRCDPTIRDALCVNAQGVAKYLLSRAVSDAGYKVVITGEGLDEILGGYAHFRRDMLLYKPSLHLPRDREAALDGRDKRAASR